MSWPATKQALIDHQVALGRATPPPWRPEDGGAVGGCFVCFTRGPSGPGRAGERGWAGAAVVRDGTLAATAVVEGTAGAPYEEGLLALREGPLLEAAIRALEEPPDVLLVNATGRDHPRRAGLAVHLGAMLELPTIGVTHRPLLATGAWPDDAHGATAPLELDGELVGRWVRTRAGRRPLAVHAAWRTDPDLATRLVLDQCGARTPEPLRQARRVARRMRSGHA
ncbi:MAG TPA: endonuclease V [Gaiellaceae bacterium]|jgi:deoxyribonuclease V|nr:endonuclease V [Gaiellaceae bacterium]